MKEDVNEIVVIFGSSILLFRENGMSLKTEPVTRHEHVLISSSLFSYSLTNMFFFSKLPCWYLILNIIDTERKSEHLKDTLYYSID